jgi:hypothetical protein
MSVKIFLRTPPPRVPEVYAEIKDPPAPTPPVEHPAPLMQIHAQPRSVHYAPSGRYVHPVVTPPPPALTPPVITTASPIAVAPGDQLAIQLAATGNAPPFTWAAANLPQALSISASGLISGQLVGAPVIYNSGGTINVARGIDMALFGMYGTPPYTFSAVSLPAGVTLSGGKLSTTLLGPASYPITLAITDSADVSKQFTFAVNIIEAGTPTDAGIYSIADAASIYSDLAGTQQAVIGDAVALVKDLSGYGNDLTQSTAAARPILSQDSAGIRYLQFNGAQFLSAGGSALNLHTSSLVGIVGAKFDTLADASLYTKALWGDYFPRYWLIRINGTLDSGMQTNLAQPEARQSIGTTLGVLTSVLDRSAGVDYLRISGAIAAQLSFAHDPTTDYTTTHRFLVGAYNNPSDTGEVNFLIGRIYFLGLYLLSSIDYSALETLESAIATQIGA